MFDGTARRVVSLWFPRLASDRAARRYPALRHAPALAIIRHEHNRALIACLSAGAEARGLRRGMALSEARAFCADLQTRPADSLAEAHFLHGLRRWAGRYCPWVGLEPPDGLVLDITGAAHLWGGEPALLADLSARLERAGIAHRCGLGDTRGAAWARAHFAATPEAPLEDLPVAALRLPAEDVTTLERLGLRRIGQLDAAPRAPLTRRFGPALLQRLDQARGLLPEPVSPLPDPPPRAVTLTLPEPIGRVSDVMAALARLLPRLCDHLAQQGRGAQVLALRLRRVDHGAQDTTLRLARPLRDPARILPLFERGLEAVDAGFGIDHLRLEARLCAPLPPEQTDHDARRAGGQLEDLLTRIGTRIGLDNILRFQPVDSHLPEQALRLVPAQEGADWAGMDWMAARPRPLILFDPEAIAARGSTPPLAFRWRGMALQSARLTGPERIAPQWWQDDPGWRRGLRDYWVVETREGLRLWLFHTPQMPGWFVQGVFA